MIDNVATLKLTLHSKFCDIAHNNLRFRILEITCKLWHNYQPLRPRYSISTLKISYFFTAFLVSTRMLGTD